MGIYIHIPFCNNICTYCDFCKFLYNEKWIKKYLGALKKEIAMKYKNDEISSIYIGGGTPSALKIEDLKELFKIISSFKIKKSAEFTFECNIEDINKSKLELLKNNGVNRISIGIESFNNKHLEFLGRNYKSEIIIEKVNLAKKYFNNINIDLIYAVPNQTIEELESDIDNFIKLNINHISTYSLIIEPNTKLYINKIENIDEDKDFEMYNLICERLKDNGYKHYEISNFAKEGYESKHNLVYWNNGTYYGFGIGASGYINNIRYENTRNPKKYFEGNYVLEKEKIDLNRKLEDEFMLGFRKIEGINKREFYQKYNIDVKDILIVRELLSKNMLIETKDSIFINPKYIYISNEILEKFINSDLLVH